MSHIRIASIVITLAACAFWALAIAGIWDHWDPSAMPVECGAAVTVALVAVMLWLARWAREREDRRYRQMDGEYRRREAALIRTFDRLTTTKPLPRIP